MMGARHLLFFANVCTKNTDVVVSLLSQLCGWDLPATPVQVEVVIAHADCLPKPPWPPSLRSPGPSVFRNGRWVLDRPASVGYMPGCCPVPGALAGGFHILRGQLRCGGSFAQPGGHAPCMRSLEVWMRRLRTLTAGPRTHAPCRLLRPCWPGSGRPSCCCSAVCSAGGNLRYCFIGSTPRNTSAHASCASLPLLSWLLLALWAALCSWLGVAGRASGGHRP